MIELVMVIVVLGILAATALPKFVNLGKDARAAALESMRGSLNASIAMIHGAALIAQKTSGTLTVSGIGDIALVNGYPQNTAVNLNQMLQYDATSFKIADGSITHAKATTADTCKITMDDSKALNTPPAVVIYTEGC